MKHTLFRFSRVLIALLGIAAVATDIYHGVTVVNHFTIANYFSYFTVESAIVTILVLSLSTVSKKIPPMFRGFAAFAMVTTGTIYFLLLRNDPVAIVWVNAVLHYILPAAMLIDWAVTRSSKSLSVGRSLLWLMFPAIYTIYTLLRGAVVGWYPYPFIDVSQLGYDGVLMAIIPVAIGMAIIAIVVGKVPKIAELVREK